jgi:Zn-finger nucleic acid-binding protein
MLNYAAQNITQENTAQQHNSTPGQYNQHHKHVQGYSKPYKKKSFLGDLFDFD